MFLKDSKDINSTVPSRMKREVILDMSMGETIKVKARSVVMTNPKENVHETVSSNHITICDDNGIMQGEIDAEKSPIAFEEGGQATVDELRQIDLGTPEDPRPIFVSSNLTSEELKTYEEILKEYRDVFAWSYKEMPGLSPKVAVHYLAVKSDVNPVK